MEKDTDTRTLSAEIFENCGDFLIVEDYAPLFSKENLFLVEMVDETFNIWHIYSVCKKLMYPFGQQWFQESKKRFSE